MSWSRDGIFIQGPRAPLQHRCALCMTTHGTLLKCTGCRLVRYCGEEHQGQHRPQHKWLCRRAAKLRDRAQDEDHRIRYAVASFLTPANAFETHVGSFGSLLSTQEYMIARLDVARHAMACGTLDGAVEALDLFRDLIRLDRRDNLGVRGELPALMLRLDLDQECYDFVKWLAEAEINDNYRWADMSLPFERAMNADVLEEPVFLLRRWSSFDSKLAILLLKLKLLIDIRNLTVAGKVMRNRLPLELWPLVERDVIRSPLSARFIGRADLTAIEDTLIDQCYYLGVHMGQSNRQIIYALLNPTQELLSCKWPNPLTQMASPGPSGPSMLALRTSYLSWWETLGALDLLQEARARAAYLAGRASKRLPPGRVPPTAKDPLDLSQMWEHFDYAVEKSSFLGPLHVFDTEDSIWDGYTLYHGGFLS